MRIGMISQWYEPETGSAAHPTAIARALHERGHDLRVLTGFPSYPLGRVYDGHRMRPRATEVRDGISLLRVPDVPSHDRSAVRRMVSLGSFAGSATTQVGWLRRVDVCLVYLTPATVGMAAMTLRRVWGVPYVLYVQDLWPETVTASGFIGGSRTTDTVERALHAWLARLYRGAAGIAAIAPTMAATLSGRGSQVTPVSIPNWVDEDVFVPSAPLDPSPLDGAERWVMYAGSIGDVQGLDTAVRAMRQLDDLPDLGLAFVGDGVAVPGLRALAAELGVAERVAFLGSHPLSDMPPLMANADAQLVSLRDLPLFRGTIPSKLQATMACGLPVVCAVAGDAAEVVRQARCGFVARPDDPTSLAGALRAVAAAQPAELRAMGARGREAYAGQMSRAVGAERLEQLLVTAAGSRR
ncbi:Glycosyltransferase involved in cell wall bisynthesis [Nocardioides exalbidus]|uniref:Glycosyltransferase involved in cell wall bisynthesis n=1 Tax=Nocardioides exalbidus TaxID=402596 RepID=A0A1H4MRV5_9ACTN|nr:glycosyltransferase family 4 protein [Nocardioides exalbidus]SEB85729.1 Glycosyltransferase involved in cell wall bisynthesis [Nocardioides exalbidus]